jgi:hypothetical protein
LAVAERIKMYATTDMKARHYLDGCKVWTPGMEVESDQSLDLHETGEFEIVIFSSILGAAEMQEGGCRYFEVAPLVTLGAEYQGRLPCSCIRVLKEVDKDDLNKLAGFNLREANRPINPWSLPPKEVTPRDIENLSLVPDIEYEYEGEGIMTSAVWNYAYSRLDERTSSVFEKMLERYTMRRRILWKIAEIFPRYPDWECDLRDSAGAACNAYYASLFVESPAWRPILDLWYRGFVPSYDGAVWRLHGAAGKVVYE